MSPMPPTPPVPPLSSQQIKVRQERRLQQRREEQRHQQRDFIDNMRKRIIWAKATAQLESFIRLGVENFWGEFYVDPEKNIRLSVEPDRMIK